MHSRKYTIKKQLKNNIKIISKNSRKQKNYKRTACIIIKLGNSEIKKKEKRVKRKKNTEDRKRRSNISPIYIARGK